MSFETRIFLIDWNGVFVPHTMEHIVPPKLNTTVRAPSVTRHPFVVRLGIETCFASVGQPFSFNACTTPMAFAEFDIHQLKIAVSLQ